MPESSYAQCLETLNVRVSKSMAISINTSLLPSILLVVLRLIFTAANCHPKYEWSSGRFDQTGIKHRAMLGHSFKNFTVKTTFDCHVKCFDERCRCQAYQILGNRCELLDEDAYSAPDDLVSVVGYSYFDINREYVVKVKNFVRWLWLPAPSEKCGCTVPFGAHYVRYYIVLFSFSLF